MIPSERDLLHSQVGARLYVRGLNIIGTVLPSGYESLPGNSRNHPAQGGIGGNRYSPPEPIRGNRKAPDGNPRLALSGRRQAPPAQGLAPQTAFRPAISATPCGPTFSACG
jgi:hypothetical protein